MMDFREYAKQNFQIDRGVVGNDYDHIIFTSSFFDKKSASVTYTGLKFKGRTFEEFREVLYLNKDQ